LGARLLCWGALCGVVRGDDALDAAEGFVDWLVGLLAAWLGIPRDYLVNIGKFLVASFMMCLMVFVLLRHWYLIFQRDLEEILRRDRDAAIEAIRRRRQELERRDRMASKYHH